MNIELLWFMVIAHCLADMSWQPSFIAHNKNRRWILMFFHALSVTGVVSIPLYIFNVFNWWLIIWLLLTHIVIDTWKSRVPKDDDHFWAIYVDQGAHLICMILAVLLI